MKNLMLVGVSAAAIALGGCSMFHRSASTTQSTSPSASSQPSTASSGSSQPAQSSGSTASSSSGSSTMAQSGSSSTTHSTATHHMKSSRIAMNSGEVREAQQKLK